MSSILLIIIVIVVLVAINAFYVAAEFALLAAPSVSLEQRAASETWAARMLATQSNTAHQDHYIAVAQLGVTLSSLALGMYSEHALAKLFLEWITDLGLFGASPQAASDTAHMVATVTALVLLTYIHVVVGEMVPKSMAILNPMVTARFVDLPMHISGIILAPFVHVLNWLGNGMLHLLKLPVSEESVLVYSPEELSLVFEESKDEGLLQEERYDWLRHLLELEERTVGQVMVARTKVVGLSEELTVSEAMEVLSREGYSRYPIYRGDMDHIDGVVHVRDMFKALREGKPHLTMGALKRPCPKFPESVHLDQVLEEIRSKQSHLAAVVDEHGGIAGIVTLEDLVEEVFGEVYDEFDDKEQEPITEESANQWLVTGPVLLEDLEDLLEINLTSEDVDTISGFVMDLLGRLPLKGDVVTTHGISIEVVEVEDMVPALCRVRRLEPEPQAEETKPPEA